VRVLHLGETTPTIRAWKRVADFYGIRVDFCSTVAEARAILLAQLNEAAAAASAEGKGGEKAMVQLPTLTVDLDLGVSEQECASQLYTLAPTRVMYLTSTKKGKAELFSDSDEAVSSTPVIVPSSPTQSGPASQHEQQAAGGMAAPFTGVAVKHQAHYPCLRRRLMKPIKVRTLVRQTLELTLEPMPSAAWTASPLSGEGDTEAGTWTPSHDEFDAAGSRSRAISVSSASSTGYWSPSVPVTPSNGGTPMQFSTPPTTSTNKRAPKILNIAQQFPLRYTRADQRPRALRTPTRSNRAARSQRAECSDGHIVSLIAIVSV
jgi:hypothetical protein